MTVANAKLRMVLLLVLLVVFGQGLKTSAQPPNGHSYTVQREDTLWKLAEKYLGNGNRYGEIVTATKAKQAKDPLFASIDNPNVIHAGSQLWIPAANVVTALSTATDPSTETVQTVKPNAPVGGKIAFSFWNNSPDRCTYETNIINVSACLAGDEACRTNRHIFPLNNASEPALSSNGQLLAFRGWGAIPEKYKGDQVNHPYYGCPGPFAEPQLGHTTLDSTNYHRMGGFREDSHPDWSPDGNRLLFDTAREGDGITRIMSISADGLKEETLRIAGEQPSWAPDNERFVYRGCDLTGNRCGLWMATALPVEAWDLGINIIGALVEEQQAAHPDWSPVAEQIVYQSPAAGSWDLYLANTNGTTPQRLTNDPGIEGLPVWSPDGQWVAYLSDKGGNWGIWIIRADGSQRHQLFSFDGGIFTPLAVPPYGQRDWLNEQISWSR